MDYRELENRMERNRDLIKERAYDRLIEEAKKANRPQRTSWFARLRSILLSLMQRKAEPHPNTQVGPAINKNGTKKAYLGKG